MKPSVGNSGCSWGEKERVGKTNETESERERESSDIRKSIRIWEYIYTEYQSIISCRKLYPEYPREMIHSYKFQFIALNVKLNKFYNYLA